MQMYGAACSSDTITIESWRKTWCDNVRANFAHFGSFKKHSVGQLYQINKNRPAIIIGSGPSLAYNGEHLRANKDILTLSCLHNYHFFEDRGLPIDYFVSLDAGPVVLEEVSEGGKKTEAEYWASTKDKKLIAFIGSNPELFKKWQGEVYLYNAPISDPAFDQALLETEPFFCMVSNGGNVLGACLYIAKAFMGSNPIAFVGADFSFSQNTGQGNKFHAWDSKYDKNIGSVKRGVDVYGNKVLTWQSYFNFKNWFDFITLQVPGLWVNCTEGGMFGAYPEGNLMSLKQMPLADFLDMYQMSDRLKAQVDAPHINERRLLF